ncbi:nucleoid-associated protein [Pedobacter sp. Leaf250]|uniref:nucleoid-associated protein n=1 Tax=Pedobacter sp. Leaf250 TaxID=2876559 RepID=UPI001E5DA909|nr:nucleoid-associated protein [Pedobacter sp. Leaf250]
MISFFEANLKSISVHHTGNKLLEEYYKLSDKPLDVSDELLNNILMQFFLKPFNKSNEVYRFFHPSSNLHLNEVYELVSGIFADNEVFHQESQQLAKLLYDVANHPKIRSGEFYVALFEKVQIEGEQLDAIGIFKSETKETYLSIAPELDGFKMSYNQDAISVNRLDKGCLIFNTEKSEGYKVVVFDNNKTNAAVYWKDEFLQLSIRNDSYNQTTNFLNLFKNFVLHKIDDQFEVSQFDKSDLLNRSIKYFKEKETFDREEFSAEVIANEVAKESFTNYQINYEEEFESPIADVFEIADSAVKKATAGYKRVTKLDKNFLITITGNKELVEKGFDEDKSMNYYKLYFREEA